MRTLLMFVLVSLFAASAFGQTQHTVTLTWTDTANPAGTTYAVYRATGVCTGSPAFSKIVEGLTVKTYEDATVQPGNYCYVATASYSGTESAYSNSALAPVPSWAPTGLTVTVK